MYFEFRGSQFWLADTTYSVLVYRAKKLSRDGRVVASESSRSVCMCETKFVGSFVCLAFFYVSTIPIVFL